ncbi:hypothetical protein H0274_13730 [Altererythrobacter sp. CC-YST694]|uniref:hypothetical protein n=1 Tax=Altererythrobacter sp. CC-YST694 TaxID=2755038 RepID=UPI001D016294|nr:hypothetical protein [Altererythrobacter sp. CC-YST694]MCB5426323.1 hypothetical protein [Altererythrobacter sp. CC-YST694]
MSEAGISAAWNAVCALDCFTLEVQALGAIAELLASSEYLDNRERAAFRGFDDSLRGIAARMEAKCKEIASQYRAEGNVAWINPAGAQR